MTHHSTHTARSLTLATLITAALASPAAAWSTLSEDFTGASLDDTQWVLSGDARLTGGVEDADGDGWLRLTDAQSNQRAWAYYDVPIPTDEGIVVHFDYAAWGGIGADGITAFLFDGSIGSAGQPPFRVGGWGGSLGYAPRCTADGMRGGYVGVGFDEYGNFSNSSECREGGAPTGLTPDAVAVRGSAASNYALLTNGAPLAVNLDCPRGSCPSRPDALGDGLHTIRIAIVPDRGTFTLSVSMRSVPGAPFEVVVEEYTLPDAPPDTLKFGWTASTGNSHNVHEIRRLFIYDPSNEPVDPLDRTDSDSDGILDEVERSAGTDPDDPDSDSDGLCDGPLELEGICAGGEDMNADGVVDPDETDPSNPDSDSDGILDGVEVLGEHGTDPLDPDSDSDGLCDGPLDRLPDCANGEDLNANGVVDPLETDPSDPDSDGGGVGDGEERIARGTDPLEPSDDTRAIPAPIPTPTPTPGELPVESPPDDPPILAQDPVLEYAGTGCAQAPLGATPSRAPTPLALALTLALGAFGARRSRRRTSCTFATIAALSCVSLHASSASAQELGAEVGVSRARVDQQRDINEVATTHLLGHLRGSASLGASYAHRPLVVLVDGAQTSDVIAGRLSPQLGLSLGLFGWLQLSGELPMVAYQTGRDLSDDLSPRPEITGPAMGDARLEARGVILDPRDLDGFGLALALGARAPTGDVATLNSDGAWLPEVTLVGDWRHPFTGLRLALNVGVIARSNEVARDLVIGNEVMVSAAAETPVGIEGVRLRSSITSAAAWSRFGQDAGAEVSVGATWSPTTDLLLSGRLGVGIGQAPGIPTARVGASLTWSPSLGARPVDLIDATDSREPEAIVLVTAATPPAPPLHIPVLVTPPLEIPGPPPLPPLEPPPPPAAHALCVTESGALDLDDRIFFQHDSATLEPRSAEVVSNLARRLEDRADLGRVTVEGHTSAAGSSAYNDELSLERARAVALALVEGGLEPARVDARAWGESRPLRDGDDPLAPTLNRRVEIHVERAERIGDCVATARLNL